MRSMVEGHPPVAGDSFAFSVHSTACVHLHRFAGEEFDGLVP